MKILYVTLEFWSHVRKPAKIGDTFTKSGKKYEVIEIVKHERVYDRITQKCKLQAI